MANAPQMKIPIQADTSDFDKGAKKVKQEMKDLNKVSSDALASIGNALGVDVGKLQQFSSALSGLGNKLAQTGREGTTAFGNISNSVASVAAGIAGLGLAAAIVAFKQLNAEADAFEATIQGGIIKAQTEAYASTVRQSIRDQQGAGKGFAGFRQYVKEVWTDTMAAFQSGFDSEVYQAALKAGGRAKELATEIYNLELQRKQVSVEVSKIDSQIAEKREIISDTTKSATVRAKALAEAQTLIQKKLDMQLPIAQKLSADLKEFNGLSSTKLKDYDAEIAAEITVNSLLAEKSTEMRSLERSQKTITTAAQQEAVEQQKIKNILKEQADLRTNGLKKLEYGKEMGGLDLTWGDQVLKTYENGVRSWAGAEVLIPVKLAPPQNREEIVKTITDISQEIESIVNDMAVSVGESLGTLIGDLINGEDPWQNFANSALSAFGDLAVSVGKMAIQTGVATLGIKAALESLNGYVAIAAGVALVALGTAVKTGLSNAANGNYSSGASVATSNASSSITSDYEQRDVYVKVTGTLEADGDQLVAVINNSNKKTQFTT